MKNNNETVDIYIYSRPVSLFGLLGNTAPQHLFIIMEFGDGTSTCIRGGPKRGNKDFIDMLTEDLQVTVSPYKGGHIDFKEDIDYKTLPHSHIGTVSKSIADAMINQAKDFAKSINGANLDYKLPLTFLPGGGQNSNTIARYVVEDVWGLKFKLPTYSVQTDIFSTQLGGSQVRIMPFLFLVEDKTLERIDVFAPGINERLQTTYFDQLIHEKPSIFDKYPTLDKYPNYYKYDKLHSSTNNDVYKTWYNPFSCSYKSFTDLSPYWKPTLLDRQINLLQDYKSEFYNHPKQYNFEKNNFYTGKWNIQDNQHLTRDNKYKLHNRPSDRFLEEMEVISTFREYVKLCLNDPNCKDDTHDLMSKALAFHNIQIKDQLYLRMQSYTEAAKEAKITILMGAWTNELREELKYAASHVSPLVLDLDGDGIKLFSYNDGVYFDIDNDGFAEKVGWLSPGDGHLAIDANYNGKIDDITELFGDDLISAFFKLSLLDSNNDKVIDQKDVAFEKLLIWQDKNFNGLSELGELKTLREANIKSISLHNRPDNRIIEGNTITSTSTFTYEDGRIGEIADVHYHNDDMDSWYTGKKVDNSINKGRYSDHIMEFRQEVLDELSKRINDPDSIDRTSDWIADIIENKAIKYISSYTQKSIILSQLELEAINSLNQQKKRELKKFCQNEEKTLENNIASSGIKKAEEESSKLFKSFQNVTYQNEEDINLRYSKEYKQAEQEARRDINVRLEREKKNFDANYAAEYSRKNTEIEGDINARLLKKNQEDLRSGQSKGLNQSDMDKIFAANLAEFNAQYTLELSTWNREHHNKAMSEWNIITEKYTKEYQNKQTSLRAFYAQKVKQEVTEINENESKKYSTAVADMKNKSAEKILDNIAQALHTHRQFCQKENTGLNALLSSYFAKYTEVAEKNLDDYSNYIKHESNTIYRVLNEKIFEYLTKEKTDDLNISNWLSGILFTDKYDNEDDQFTKIDLDTLSMPLMRGYGKIPALHISMTLNSKLKTLVRDFMKLDLSTLNESHNKIVEILYEWGGVSNIPEDERAEAGVVNIEARKVAFIEQMTGQEFRQLGITKSIGQHASAAVQKAYDIALTRLTKNLLIQGPLAIIFPKAQYSFIEDNIKLNSTLNEILTISKDIAMKHKLGYEFFVQLGYILVCSIEELNTNLNEIRDELSKIANEPIMLDFEGLIGDDRNNIIKGTTGSDYIKGLGGDDILYGKDGSDHVEGNDGNDQVYGGDGIDRLYGGKGDDRMYGGKGRDFIYGEEGNDEIHGEEGDDQIEGGIGADIMDGGEGINTLSYGSSSKGVYVALATQHKSTADQISDLSQQTGDATGDKFKNFQNLGGSEFNDYLIGDNNNNYINGESGDDIIEGLDGDDTLFGANGSDKLFGGNGDDIFIGFEGSDYMNGGSGKDTASYHHPYATEGIIVDLKKGYAFGGYAHNDTYESIENVIGSKHGDFIYGDDGDNVLNGMEGDDVIEGAGGNDVIFGGAGQDHLSGKDGDDQILLIGDGDEADGGDGIDTISYMYATNAVILDMSSGIASTNVKYKDKFVGFENASGSIFDDNIKGDDNDNVIEGNSGSDRIDGKLGFDIIGFINSKEGVIVNLKDGIGHAGDAKGDTYINIEGIIGSQKNDTLIGDNNANILVGNDGDDKIYGEDGDDILVGGNGADFLDGGKGMNFASYYNSLNGVIVNLAEKIGHKGDAEGDTYINIEGVIGSKFDDKIIGSQTSDILRGEEGDDEIHGLDGDDVLYPGEGSNKVYGDSGDDKFYLKNKSNNFVDGGDGSDTISYEKYKTENYEEFVKFHTMLNDGKFLPQSIQDDLPIFNLDPNGVQIDLNNGSVIKQNNQKDTIANIENIIGSILNDTIKGNAQNNYINGLDGDDVIFAGDGNDTLIGGLGANEIHGEGGNDLFIASLGFDRIFGGEGNDSISYQYSNIGVKINLESGECSDGYANGDTLSDIENIEGSKFCDTLYDSKGDNIIKADDGDDLIFLSDGNDVVFAGDGDDKLFIDGSGDKYLSGGSGADHFIFYPSFSTNGKFGTIILDFELTNSQERIDLRQFKIDDVIALSKNERCNIAQITSLPPQSKTNNEILDCTVIALSANQIITLFDVNSIDLSNDNFILHDPVGISATAL